MNNKKLLVGFVCISILSAAFVFSLGRIIYTSKERKSVENGDTLFGWVEGGVVIPRLETQARWIRLLDKNNPELHDAIIAAMLVSKDSGKEIFVLRENKENKKLKYRLSLVRGNANNMLSYTHYNRWFSFDHYNDKDGPWLSTAENQLFIENKINRYYKELEIK